jgi:hypothetical protein
VGGAPLNPNERGTAARTGGFHWKLHSKKPLRAQTAELPDPTTLYVGIALAGEARQLMRDVLCLSTLCVRKLPDHIVSENAVY